MLIINNAFIGKFLSIMYGLCYRLGCFQNSKNLDKIFLFHEFNIFFQYNLTN